MKSNVIRCPSHSNVLAVSAEALLFPVLALSVMPCGKAAAKASASQPGDASRGARGSSGRAAAKAGASQPGGASATALREMSDLFSWGYCAGYADASHFWLTPNDLPIQSASSESSFQCLRIITSHRLMHLRKIWLLKYRFAVDAVAEDAFVVAEEYFVVAEERADVPEDVVVVAEDDPGLAEDRAVVAEDVVFIAKDDPVDAEDDFVVVENDPVEAQAVVAVDAQRQHKPKKKKKKSTPNTLHSGKLARVGPSHGLSQPVTPGLLGTSDNVDTDFREPHEVTEEQHWQRKLEKRIGALSAIKKKYSHSRHCNSATRLLTPEPSNRTISKRQWEASVKHWRDALKMQLNRQMLKEAIERNSQAFAVAEALGRVGPEISKCYVCIPCGKNIS